MSIGTSLWRRSACAYCGPDGNLFFINYPKQNAYLRVKYLDEYAHAVHDYVWVYNTNIGHTSRPIHHRPSFHPARHQVQAQPLLQGTSRPALSESYRPSHQRAHPARAQGPDAIFVAGASNLVKNISRQKTNHPCQIPEGLSELLFKSCTIPGDAAFVLFGGSGSEVAQAKNLGLTYLTCELQTSYCEIIESRLRNDGEIEPAYRHPAQLKRYNGHHDDGSLSEVQRQMLEQRGRYS